MKKVKSSGSAMSTDAKAFDSKGSSKGIPASMSRGVTAKTKGNTAKFAAGKKKVSK